MLTQRSAACSTLMAQRPMARTDLRTKSTSTSVAYLSNKHKKYDKSWNLCRPSTDLPNSQSEKLTKARLDLLVTKCCATQKTTLSELIWSSFKTLGWKAGEPRHGFASFILFLLLLYILFMEIMHLFFCCSLWMYIITILSLLLPRHRFLKHPF